MSAALLTVAASYYLAVAIFAGHLLTVRLLQDNPSFSAFKAWCFAWSAALVWPLVLLVLLVRLAWRKGIPR